MWCVFFWSQPVFFMVWKEVAENFDWWSVKSQPTINQSTSSGHRVGIDLIERILLRISHARGCEVFCDQHSCMSVCLLSHLKMAVVLISPRLTTMQYMSSAVLWMTDASPYDFRNRTEGGATFGVYECLCCIHWAGFTPSGPLFRKKCGAPNIW